MKIGLDLNSQAVKEYSQISETPSFTKTEKSGAARLDITGMFTDDNAYGVHGRTTEDVSKEAQAIDTDIAMKYMAVMSNIMSEEDYAKAMEEGIDFAKLEPEEAVTILDHIKAVMAESGQIVAGFNDNLDTDTLIAMKGSVSDANRLKEKLKSADLEATDETVRQIEEAIAMMSGIDSISDGTVKYMVDNDLEPTIENIYTSRFSAMGDGNRQAKGYYAQETGGYYAKKADNVNADVMKPQIEKAVEAMELPGIDSDEATEYGMWLLEKGLPVTEEKIRELNDIRSVSFPISQDKLEDSCIGAIGEGKSASSANLADSYKTVYSEAKDILGALKDTISREETRLSMMLTATMSMLKRGVELDTSDLTKLVEDLKLEEQSIFKEIYGDGSVEEIEDRASLFEQTKKVLSEIPALPAAVLGQFHEKTLTLTGIHTAGVSLKSEFDRVNARYEELMTAPRADMGDSIRKAFRNVDDILADMHYEINDENRRAVRILGYNSMVINEDSIEEIKSVDNRVQEAVRSLTPAKVLQMIREGINPLIEDIDVLTEKVNALDSTPEAKNEKFSKFLYKLEQSKEITETERESFIGIYRMLNRLEKTDYASVGRLVESGVDITFGNLLKAMRSKKTNMDVHIDDNFGVLEKTVKKGRSITEQITEAFVGTFSEFTDDELEARYQKEQVESYRGVAGDVSKETIEELIRDFQSLSADNVEAMQQFVNDRNSLFQTLTSYAKRVDKRKSDEESEKKLLAAVENFKDSFEDKDEAIKGYKSLVQVMKDTLAAMTDIGADTRLDIKSIALMHKQLSLASGLSTEENYHVPVMIGDKLTDINLKLLHGEDTGLVIVNMNTEKYGDIRSEIRVNGLSHIDALFIAENKDTIDRLNPIASAFSQRIEAEGYSDMKINFTVGNPHHSNKYSVENADNNNVAVSTKTLYRIAKVFIDSVVEA